MTDVRGPGGLETEIGHRIDVFPFAGFWSCEFGGNLVHEASNQFPLGLTSSYSLATHKQQANGNFVASNGIYPVSGLFQMSIEPNGHIGGNLMLVVAGEFVRQVRLSGTLLFDIAFTKPERLWGSAVVEAETDEAAFPLELKMMAVSHDLLAWMSMRPAPDRNPVSILVAGGSLLRCTGIDRRSHEHAIAVRGGRP